MVGPVVPVSLAMAHIDKLQGLLQIKRETEARHYQCLTNTRRSLRILESILRETGNASLVAEWIGKVADSLRDTSDYQPESTETLLSLQAHLGLE